MNAIMTIIAIVTMVALAIVVLGFRDRQAWRNRNTIYLHVQATRTDLMDAEFCSKANIPSSSVATIGIIRTNLAEFGQCKASRIYPEDMLSDFGLNYDDDVAMLVQKMGVIPGFIDFSFPLEEVDNVAGFVKLLFKMKENAEQGH